MNKKSTTWTYSSIITHVCSIVKGLFHEKYKLVDEINGENSLKKNLSFKNAGNSPCSMGSINLCQLMHAVNGLQSFDSYIDLTLIVSSLHVP